MSKLRKGALRNSPQLIDQVLRRQLLKPDKTTQDQIHVRLKIARRLSKLCASFRPGLLLLLPTSQTNVNTLPRKCRDLAQHHIDELFVLLEANRVAVTAAYKVGLSILDMFKREFEFIFKYHRFDLLIKLKADDLLAFLQPKTYPNTDSPIAGSN